MTEISPQQERANNEHQVAPRNLVVRPTSETVEWRQVEDFNPLGTSIAATTAPFVRSELMRVMASAISARGSPSKPVPSSASTTTPASAGASRVVITRDKAASRSATASGDLRGSAAATSTTLTLTSAAARAPATTQPSPPLLPGQ